MSTSMRWMGLLHTLPHTLTITSPARDPPDHLLLGECSVKGDETYFISGRHEIS